MKIFYFSPNVDWELVESVYGEDYTDVETLTIEQCRTLHTFADKEWGGEIYEFEPSAYEEAFNEGTISDEGSIRIFNWLHKNSAK